MENNDGRDMYGKTILIIFYLSFSMSYHPMLSILA